MTRAARRRAAFAAALCLLSAAWYLAAQTNRESYRNLYRAWREADPNLEIDAGAAAPGALASRAEKAASLASAFTAARSAAIKDTAAAQVPNQQWLDANSLQPLPALAPAPDETRLVNRESAADAASVSTFANDPDRAIQQLRQAFQREQAALQALRSAIANRQQAEDKNLKSVNAAELARAKATQEFSLLSSALNQTVAEMNQESAAWSTYYSRLAAAAAKAPSPAAPPATSSVTSPPSGTTSASAAPAAPSVALPRYTGMWSYRMGSAYFGSQPEVVDFTLHEDKGHATGTFYGRFKIPPGSSGDPVLRFEFSGDFKPTSSQFFKLTTADGASGTLQLNPGIAFNEIEVNFTTDITPGKVHQGDMILLKQ